MFYNISLILHCQTKTKYKKRSNINTKYSQRTTPLKIYFKGCMQWRVHAFNPGDRETEAGGLWIQSHPGLGDKTLPQKNEKRRGRQCSSVAEHIFWPYPLDSLAGWLWGGITKTEWRGPGSICRQKRQCLLLGWLSVSAEKDACSANSVAPAAGVPVPRLLCLGPQPGDRWN